MCWVKEVKVCHIFRVTDNLATIFVQDARKGLNLSVIPISLVNLIVWKTKLWSHVTALDLNSDKVKVILPKSSSKLKAIESNWAQKFFRGMPQYSE